MIAAAVDVGTNSTRLLVAELNDHMKINSILHTDLISTRLGEGMALGYLGTNAMERTLSAIIELVGTARSYGAQMITIIATSAVRDAANGKEFADMVMLHTGCSLEILPGEKEAELSYRGVLAGMPGQPRGVVVVDVGGGSTEISWNEKGAIKYTSVNVGAVRMHEGGYTEEQIIHILTPVLSKINKQEIAKIVFVGGTITTLAAMIQGLAVYHPDKIHGYKMSIEQIDHMLYKLQSLSLGERKKLPGLQPQRADIITSGIIIVKAVLKGLGCNRVTVSEADILWGTVINAASIVER